MATIKSATTSFVGADRGARWADFIAKAHVLLLQADRARKDGVWDQALELAYQAGLRTAGACIADSDVAKRRRRSSSAWAQLRLVDDRGAQWATAFEHYSLLRSRVASGIERSLDPRLVDHIIALAGEFIAEVEADAGSFGVAA
ncbi:SAV_6107 family HEPN domain-containing protein [Corynebacterium alimapuense]|uniref:SAV-6107-like HEPN domain-containing protein n=1 Tax=Corynebacterium alimapuense TaxID=1576874 RepID=A0A3M8K8P1_9CORY|nr:SAV_6107 family HEPN domain-containing protein [Corynebacterium alimapuense]RNE49496.1 hypothetical protein C5L39_03855 [Corynebacterium alimapuense]